MHWFYDPDIELTSTSISKTELIHFKSLRISSGDHIAITSGKGLGIVAKLVDPQNGEIQVLEQLPTTQAPKVHLFQAIAKGDRDEAALQACVELGISGATAFEAERSVANWRSKVDKQLARWEQIAISAIKQSQQLHLPTISYAASAAALKPIGKGLVLDPRAQQGIADVQKAERFSVVVGPEGGFSEGELLALEASGFERVRLGRSVLRTSTAGVVAVSALQLLSGEYGGRLG